MDRLADMTKSPAAAALDSIVADVLAPDLRSMGFRKKSRHWSHEAGAWIQAEFLGGDGRDCPRASARKDVTLLLAEHGECAGVVAGKLTVDGGGHLAVEELDGSTVGAEERGVGAVATCRDSDHRASRGE